MSTDYISTSNLQVAVADGLEVSYTDCPALAHECYNHHPPNNLKSEPLEVRQNRQQRRIYGIPVFWIIICILIFIVGGAIGGGVGAGVLRNKKSFRYVGSTGHLGFNRLNKKMTVNSLVQLLLTKPNYHHHYQ